MNNPYETNVFTCPLCDGEGGYMEGLGIPWEDCYFCKSRGWVLPWKQLLWWWWNTAAFSWLMRKFHR